MSGALCTYIVSKKTSMEEGAVMSIGGPTVQRKYCLGSFANRDMLIWLRGFALDPSNMKSSPNLNPILRNQMLEFRSFMILKNAKYPQRKRKPNQCINDGKSTAAFGLNRERSGIHNPKKLRRGESSSISCPPNYIDNIGDNFQGKHVNATAFSSPNDTEECIICCQDYISDPDESIHGSNPEKKANLENHSKESKLLVSGCIYANNSNAPIQEKPNIDSLQVLKSWAIEDLDDSDSPNLESEDKKLKEALKLLLSNGGDHLPRPVIPIGPKYQAEVPKWKGSLRKSFQEDDNDLKWLGTQIWPMQSKTIETNVEAIGKGRPKSCQCDSQGSVNCVKKHINEARLRLKYDIGPAFLSWKFKEMGEDVSKSWTLKEQKKFESLLKSNPLSSDTNFWKLACENFPSKSMKSMVSYYYNVYIPIRMSLETRSSFGAVDSDDDLAEDNHDEEDC